MSPTAMILSVSMDDVMPRGRREGSGPGQKIVEPGLEILTGYLSGPEGKEVIRADLTVDQPESMSGQALDEGDESDLRCVLNACEHGFAEKDLSKGDAIEASGKGVLVPCLDRVGETQGVKPFIRQDHLRGEPGSRTVR